MTRPIRILGIDPGLRRTGWGVVEIAGNRLGFLGCGSVLTNDRDALAARLLAIHDGLMRILDQYRPDEAAVEHGRHYTDGVRGRKDDGAMPRTSLDFRAGRRVVRKLRTARPSPG